MAGRRRTNPNNPRAGLERFAQAPEFSVDAVLGREAGAVLAVLLLASYWPGQFRDRWVTANDFGNHSRDLPKPRERDMKRRNTLRALVRRGLAELKNRFPKDIIERKSVGALTTIEDPRERSTRLMDPPTPDMERWFHRDGLDRLDPETRKLFRQHSYGALSAADATVTVLEEGVVYHLIAKGDLAGATQRAAEALERAKEPFQRRLFTLARARVELAAVPDGLGWWENLPRAIDLLRPLVAEVVSPRSAPERALQARILVAYATCLAMRAWVVDKGSEEFAYLDEARALVERARALVPDDNPLDRGDFDFADAVVEQYEGLFDLYEHHNREGAERHEARAELLTLSALSAWRRVHAWERIRNGLDHLLHTQRNIQLRHFDATRGTFLIPWLVAVVRFWDVASPDPLDKVPWLYETVVEVFGGLAADTPAEALPLPAADCHAVLKRCIAAIRGYELFYGHEVKTLAAESAMWYRAIEDTKTGRSM